MVTMATPTQLTSNYGNPLPAHIPPVERVEPSFLWLRPRWHTVQTLPLDDDDLKILGRMEPAVPTVLTHSDEEEAEETAVMASHLGGLALCESSNLS